MWRQLQGNSSSLKILFFKCSPYPCWKTVHYPDQFSCLSVCFVHVTIYVRKKFHLCLAKNGFRDEVLHGVLASPKKWVYQPPESLGTVATPWLDELIFIKHSCFPPVFCQTEFLWWLLLAQLLPKLHIPTTFEWTNFCWHAGSWKEDKKDKKHFSKQTSC